MYNFRCVFRGFYMVHLLVLGFGVSVPYLVSFPVPEVGYFGSALIVGIRFFVCKDVVGNA